MEDKKKTQLDENSSLALGDIFEIVDIGTGDSQRITAGNALNSGLITVVGTLATGDATPVVDAASVTTSGISELATTAEINTGDDTARVLNVKQFADSGFGKRTLPVTVNDSIALTSGDGKAYFTRIPSYLNGWNIIKVAANIVTGTAEVEIQIHNLTQAANILSTTLTIDANEKDSKDAAVPAVIDTNEDDVQTGDRLRIDIVDEGTATTWLDVQITVQLP